MTPSRAAVVVVLACALVAGCSGNDDGSGAEPDAVGDTPRLIVDDVERPTSDLALIEGVLLAGECVVIRGSDEDRVLIWPKGARLSVDGVELNGDSVRFGTKVRLGGGELPADALERFGAEECGPTIGWAVGSIA